MSHAKSTAAQMESTTKLAQGDQQMKHVHFQNGTIKMAGDLYLPEGFNEGKRCPAIVCAHPAGGVKEHTSGLYASKFAELGFVTLAFDASYQGQNSGVPRQLENPYARVEDISAAIDYLTTLPYVDCNRIGALGVCAGGAYATNATLNDRRIKALGTVSAANYGAIMRYGWDGTQKPEQSFKMLDMAAKARTDEANGVESPITRSRRPSGKTPPMPIWRRLMSITTRPAPSVLMRRARPRPAASRSSSRTMRSTMWKSSSPSRFRSSPAARRARGG